MPQQRFRRFFGGRITTWFTFACILNVLNSACTTPHDTTPQPIAYDIPTEQFIMYGVNLEQRRGGRVVWSGFVQRMDGTLSVATARDLVLHQQPKDPDQSPFTLRAAEGRFSFDQGQGHFQPVTLTNPAGARLDATQGDYDEATGLLHVQGPLTYQRATDMTVHAQQGTMNMRSGEVIIDGPISGIMHPRSHRDPPSPPAPARP